MFHSAGRIVTIVALCCAIGLHWIALQSVAWTTMLVENAKRAPLREAIAQTFNGANPCSLCHAVEKGKSSEKKSEFQTTTPKIDLICPPRASSLIASFVPFRYAATKYFLTDSPQTPPVPPPRGLV